MLFDLEIHAFLWPDSFQGCEVWESQISIRKHQSIYMHSAYPYKRQVQSATAKIGIICHISFTLSKKVTNNAILNFMRNYRAVLRPRSRDAGTGTVSLNHKENMTVAGTAKLLLFTNEQGKTNNNCY